MTDDIERLLAAIKMQQDWLLEQARAYKGQVAGFSTYATQHMRLNHFLVSGRDSLPEVKPVIAPCICWERWNNVMEQEFGVSADPPTLPDDPVNGCHCIV